MGIRAITSPSPDPCALADEANGDANELRQATILEAQRTRTVIEFSGRDAGGTVLPTRDWRIPCPRTIVVSILQLHADPEAFPTPTASRPLSASGRPRSNGWRSVAAAGAASLWAAFANTEMDVVLRTILRRFTIGPDDRNPARRCTTAASHTFPRTVRIVVRRRTDVA